MRRGLIFALAFLVVPTIALAASPKRIGGGSGTGPMRAFDFTQKFGVNGNLNSGGTPTTELTDMAYVGIKNIRDGAANQASTSADAWFAYVAPLAAAGIRQHFFLLGGSASTFLTPMSDFTTALKTRIVTPYGANMVTGVSGPNEPNLQGFNYNSLSGIAAANSAQTDLYAAMKADPALSGIPVDMWPPGVFSTAGAIGDQTAHCDRVNMHDYYDVDNGGGYGFISFVSGAVPVALPPIVAQHQLICNKPTYITTESGYGSTTCMGCLSSASEYAQARLAIMNMFDHARDPNQQQVYYFTLRWGSPGGSGNWGLINDDGTPKPSGTAVHYLMQILNDAGGTAATFNPAPFPYVLSGMPGQGRDWMVARSDGSYLLMLYQETPIWTISSATPISLSNSTVTITLPRAASGFVYNPIVNATTPVQTFTSTSTITVTLNDAPLIVQFGGSVAPPPPTITLVGTPGGTFVNGPVSSGTVAPTLIGGGSFFLITAHWCTDASCAGVGAITASNPTDGTQTCVPATGAFTNTTVVASGMWYCKNNTTTGSDTFTLNLSGSVYYLTIEESEWAGLSITAPDEGVGNVATGTGTAITASTGSVPGSNDLIISGFSVLGGGTITYAQTRIGATSQEYQLTGAPGAFSNSYTASTPGAWAESIAAFR